MVDQKVGMIAPRQALLATQTGLLEHRQQSGGKPAHGTVKHLV